jgi:ABC-type multidrug transport system fused ATPase/permease subunit
MFICTYIYMNVWVHTGEVTAKRIRERYLRAILRQDVAFFDKVGAGEVTTRIQTDTRTWSLSLLSHVGVPTADSTHTSRLGPTRYIREGRPRS